VENIPLKEVTQPWLTYFPQSVRRIDGNLSGDINLDAHNYNLTKASITISEPKVNYLQGDMLTTELTSANGIFTITKGTLKHLGNEYHFTGKLQPFIENPRLQANLKMPEGSIQSLLSTLQFFEFSDIANGFQPQKYSSAKDLYTSANSSLTNNETSKNHSFLTRQKQDKLSQSTNPLPVDKKQELTNQSSLSHSKTNSKFTQTKKPLVSIKSEGESLLDTLDFFQNIEKKINQEKTVRANSTLPKLEELNGNLSGSIDLTASMETGVKAEFDFQSNYWQWGKYDGDLLQLTGSYNNGLLTFLPIKIQSDQSILFLTGTFQPERISGEVTLSNFPVGQLKPLLNIPESFDIDGDINATIAISGSEEKPLAKGNIEIVNSKINGNNIEKTQASFGLRNSRIDFLARSSLNEDIDYFTMIASLPLRLFPNSIKPESDDFNIDFNLQKEGFSLLSVVTDNKLNWVEGDGNIDLAIKGKYNQTRNEITELQTEGIANLSNVVINGKVLNDGAITNINGQVLFDFDQVNISDLSGNFSGGQISLSGALPLVDKAIKGKSLNISVDDLALNLEGLYQGNAHGNLSITGTAIEPQIGGNIELENGNIQIEKKENNQSKKISKNQTLTNIKFNDLSLKLGDNLHIVQPVLLKVKAEGDLSINGELNNLSPDGIVKLKSGTVNLFTSQFKLAENRDNIARFTSNNGFNPYLDVQLESSVTETSRYQLPDNSNPNEIQDLSDFSVDTAQTIKVKANVQGWSDNLINNIELSSSPSRNQREIIALLGGGFASNFASGNSELNLVNFASAAVLGGVQGEIQKAIGFDELRLFPAQIINPEQRTSTFGLGAELALDLTDNFSVSVTKILTNEQAPRYSVRYRLNEQTILRGSSDFEQDTRGIIEFQQRF
jgi:translocation and assembly module TamB